MARRSASIDGQREKSAQEPTLPQSRQDTGENGHGAHHRREHPGGPVRVKTEGESGRRGIHPLQFLKIIWRSSSWLSLAVNVLWPIVPASIGVYYGLEEHHTLKFTLIYIAMVPCANLIGFAGQELARKLPHVYGVLLEITFVP